MGNKNVIKSNDTPRGEGEDHQKSNQCMLSINELKLCMVQIKEAS